MRDLFEATKLFNVSLKGTRTALLASGIGALAVGVAAIVAYWEDIIDLVKGTSKAIQDQIDLLSRKSDISQTELEILEKQLELNELQGKSTEELTEKKKELLRQQIIINKAELEQLKIQQERIFNQQIELNFFEKAVKAFKASQGVFDSVISDSAQERLNGITDRMNELSKLILDAEIALERTGRPDSPREETTNREEQEQAVALPITGIEGLENLQTIADQRATGKD